MDFQLDDLETLSDSDLADLEAIDEMDWNHEHNTGLLLVNVAAVKARCNPDSLEHGPS